VTGTRNAYDSLERLTQDFEKDLSRLRSLVAASMPSMSMDNLHEHFDSLLYDLRDNASDLRADLDLLTDEASQP
jgi:hypothetical protein